MILDEDTSKLPRLLHTARRRQYNPRLHRVCHPTLLSPVQLTLAGSVEAD